MPGQNRQPSFGGVAQLFGDSSAQDDAKQPKQRQASFGGVASLFGDDDDDATGNATTGASAGRRAPSFGGVANLFGGNDDGPTKPQKTGGRQASFGGVAALFGDDDDEAPDRIITKPKKAGGARQASFGGVAALFGEQQVAEADMKVTKAVNPPGKKKRDPSFGGISTLFGDTLGNNTKPMASKTSAPPKAQNADTIGDLVKAAPVKQRSKKRDPSFGGVAGLFADNDGTDDDEEEDDDQEINISFKPAVNDKLTTELQIEVENEREKVIALEGELKQAEKTNHELERRIAELEKEKASLKASKMKLIQQTSQEIDRMREVIIGIAQETASQVKAATIS